MIGRSTPEYVFIRICIFLLQYTTPICLACLAIGVGVGGRQTISHPLSRVLVAYSILDLLFALLIYAPYCRRLNNEAKHPPLMEREERRDLVRRCFSQMPNPEKYLRTWFLGAEMTEIRRENVRDLLLWAFFDRWPGQDSVEDTAELDE